MSKNNADRAMQVIADYLMAHDVGKFKLSNHNKQRLQILAGIIKGDSKFGGVYDAGGSTWPDLLTGLQTKLIDKGIKSGRQVDDEGKIKGSEFFYYRHERGPDGAYIEHGEAIGLHKSDPVNYPSSYNPFSAPDPFAAIDLSHVAAGHAQADSDWVTRTAERTDRPR
jgi:hypothetical protein